MIVAIIFSPQACASLNHPHMAVVVEAFWCLVCLTEVLLSIAVHLSYGLLFFLSSLVNDASAIVGLSSSSNAAIAVAPLVTDPPKQASIPPSRLPITHYGQFFQGHQEAPIVLVHGLFGFGKGKLPGVSYWGGAEEKHGGILVPDLGSLTSMHDRARELFYYLKGGTVDYGEEHSVRFQHARYGRTYAEGHYAIWDEDHPIHLMGHSSGGQVARVLQQMLADKAFEGHDNTSADWILSLTSLSGSINGTTRSYIDGLRPEDGQSIEPISLLQFLRVGVLLYEWLDIPILKKYYGFGFDHYHLSWHKSGFRGFLSTMLNRTGPFATGDWVLPDLAIQGAMQINRVTKTHPNTFYFSYASKRTRKFLGRTIPSAMFGIHPILLIRTWQMSRYRFPSQEFPPYPGYQDQDWHDNDGALNTFGMVYPRLPDVHPHCYIGEKDIHQGQEMKPGIWYYTILEADHITFVVNRERAGVRYDVLYDGIFQRCRKHLRRTRQIQKEMTNFHCGCVDICICNKLSSKYSK